MVSRCLLSLSCSFPNALIHVIFALYEFKDISSKCVEKQQTKSNLVQIHHEKFSHHPFGFFFTHSSLYNERSIKHFIRKYEAVRTEVLHNEIIAKYSNLHLKINLVVHFTLPLLSKTIYNTNGFTKFMKTAVLVRDT